MTAQNDLSEYFSLLNFANPNFLGTKNDFRKNFENAIIRGRDADATDAAKAECEKKLKELGGIVSKFIIRRTNDLLSKYREYAGDYLRRIHTYIPCLQSLSNTSRSYFAGRPNYSWRSIDSSSRRPRSRRCFVERTPNPSRRSTS